MRRSRVAFALGVVVPLLVLGGCSDDDPEVKVAPSDSSSPTPTPTPTESSSPTGPVEPTMPPAAMERTAAGAEAFVRHWIDLVNFAQATGETDALMALDDIQCSGCRGIVEAISKPYEAGGRIEGGNLSIGRLRELPLDHGADWAGFANGTTAAQTVYDGHGDKTEHVGAPFHFYAYTSWVGGEWRMRWLRTPTPS